MSARQNLDAIEHRDAIYCVLLRRLLPLRDEHHVALRARGLSDAEIARNGYASTPRTRAERQRVADALAPYLDAFGGDVPGFYFAHNRWEMVYCAPGYFIGVRDEYGRLRGLTYRLDESRDGCKYVWLSSNPEAEDDAGRRKYPQGASPGAPPHFANRHLMAEASELIVVEGILKSQVAAYLSGAPAVGVAGTHNTRGIAGRLCANFPKLRQIAVAYDRDVFEKPQVYDALMRLVGQLEAERFQVRVRTWPPPAKGYDDYLLSQLRRRGRAA